MDRHRDRQTQKYWVSRSIAAVLYFKMMIRQTNRRRIYRPTDKKTERQTYRVVGFHGPEFKDEQIDILINR
jgi:hypothetical protein